MECILCGGQQSLSLKLCCLQIASNKRYSAAAGKGFTVSETAKNVEDAIGKIDVVVHSLANGPEVAKPLLETSRKVMLCRE